MPKKNFPILSEEGLIPAITLVVGALLIMMGIGIGFSLGMLAPKAPKTPAAVSIESENISSDSAKLSESSASAIPLENPAIKLATPTPTPKPSPKIVKSEPVKEKTTETKKKEESTNQFSGSLNLSAESNESGKVALSWQVSGGEVRDGFKVCKSSDPNPAYKTNTCEFKEGNARSMVWEGLDSGSTLHFRVGVYVGGDVGASSYSNNVTVTVK